MWQAAVAAADPFALVRTALTEPHTPLRTAVEAAERIVVVGGGKAGAAMAAGGEAGLADRLDPVTGGVNGPRETGRPLRKIEVHPARPARGDHPPPGGAARAQRLPEPRRDPGANGPCPGP